MNEEQMDVSHLAVTCQLIGEKPIPTHALIDNGATGYAFIDKEFVRHHHLLQLPLEKPHRLEVIQTDVRYRQEKSPTTLKSH